MSHSDDDDDGAYWLDGLTPEEQLAEIDARERRVREIWHYAPPALAKAAVGSLHANLEDLEGMRERIRAGRHPTRDERTPEEKADDDKFWAQLRERIRNTPDPPGHRPYNPDED